MKFAIIVSRFNQSITEKLLQGSLKILKQNKISDQDIQVIQVPGAYEIPLMALKTTQTKKYAGIICLGCILKGETTHNHYIAESVAQGIMQISLQTGTPIAFGIITPNNLKQANERSENNSANKGAESAEAILEMIENIKKLKTNGK